MPERASIALASILRHAGWSDAPRARLTVLPSANVLPTPLPIGPMASAAIGASGLAASALLEARGGAGPEVEVDMRHATLAMAANEYLRVDGEKPASWDALTGYYPARDGRWVYLHANFPHLRDGLLQMFGAPNDRAALATAVAGWSADAVEAAAGERGLCAVAVRDPVSWSFHPQAQATEPLPLVAIERIGDAPPMPMTGGARPLSGVRVLDLSRVIAGPMAGRTLAEHGATVMLVTAAHLPAIEPLVIDTGFGKRSARVDLRTAAGDATLHALAREADVFIDAYRPGALARRGFSPDALARARPGIVVVRLSAFAQAGPYAPRRGYDTLVSAATGLTPVTPGRTPTRLPCQPLDYLTGYLAAFGAMVALQRRMSEGGSHLVTLSLERTAAWVREMAQVIGPERAVPAVSPSAETVRDLCANLPSVFGELTYLAPVARLGGEPARFERAPVPLGTDPAAWP